MQDHDRWIGTQVGNYRITAAINRGAFGNVYQAEHVHLPGHVVAIKVLHGFRGSESDHERFLQEARILSGLEHPHILALLDFGFREEQPYLIARYAARGSLRTRLDSGQLVPMEQALSWLLQIGQGLAAAHERQVVHCDLKPENILFDNADQILLADFGMATVLVNAHSQHFAQVGGSPAYMAPEQFEGVVSAQGDQYALGCIAYELLTGQQPFAASTLLEMGWKHLTKLPRSPNELNPHIPAHINAAILQALAKDRSQRYQDVSAFLQALSGPSALVLGQQTISMPATPFPETQVQTLLEERPVWERTSEDIAPITLPTGLSIGTEPEQLSPRENRANTDEEEISEDTLPLPPEEEPEETRETSRKPRELEPVTPPPRQPRNRRSFLGQNRNRERMLRRLHRSYQDLLAQSLQGIASIELGLSEKPRAVQNVTNLALRIAQQGEQTLPPGVLITQVYEDAGEELLILGEPGAGKSTLLLQLAQYLVTKAEQDDGYLLPVILPLSSWAIKQATLEEWMVEQIAVTYDIPRKVSQQWVQDEQILPLLDGLDEMEEAAYPACIAAINAYHRAHLTPLVVCSRITEYEHAASKERLALQNAVVVRPLTSEQVEKTLHEAGAAVAELRIALHEQAALQDLASTPLMLSVLMLTYEGTTTVHTGILQETSLEQQVWTDYVQRVVERKQQEHTKRYSLEQIRSWLGWLAREMQVHSQTVFYAELLQADWLSEKLQRTYNWLALRFPAIVIGVLISLLVWFFLGVGVVSNNNLTNMLQEGLIGGSLGGWLSRPVGTPTAFFSRKRRIFRVPLARLVNGLLLGLLYGIIFALLNDGGYTSLSRELRLGADLLNGVGVGVIVWVLPFLLQRIGRSSSSLLTNQTSRSHWFISVHFRRAIVIALIWGAVNGLGLGPSFGLAPRLGYGLIVGLGLGFTGFLLSLLLENEGRTLRLAERLRWDARHLIRPGHLRNSLLLATLLFLFFGVSVGLGAGPIYGLEFGLTYGLIAGFVYWLLLGFSQGIVQEQIENQDRRTFNQGIRRSLRNGLLTSLLGAGLITVVGVLSYQLDYGLISMLNLGQVSMLHLTLSFWLAYACFLAISGGLLMWATVGGLTVLRHYVVRFLLARGHAFPWHAQAFLDDATVYILLRRVGGGYSFVHRRLLDYFASLDKPVSQPEILQRVCSVCGCLEERAEARFCSNCGTLFAPKA
jgi:serine/threonine protein kinase/energy-coupling factor transporter ATP-binding protein EcfA2